MNCIPRSPSPKPFNQNNTANSIQLELPQTTTSYYPQQAPPVSEIMAAPAQNILPSVDDAKSWGLQNPYQGLDSTGQVAPPGMKAQVAAVLWEDEGSLCFQVEARGICVARREDNHMINGTKLLNVAGMTRGRRDGILMSEKVRHVAKIGPMFLKGVWIPFERALDLANKEKITEILYPLFVHNIGAFLYHPINQARSNQAMASAEGHKQKLYRNQVQANQASAELPSLQQHPKQFAHSGYETQGVQFPQVHIFPTPPTSASSVMESIGETSPGFQGPTNLLPRTNLLSIDITLSNASPIPTSPETTPPGTSLSFPGFILQDTKAVELPRDGSVPHCQESMSNPSGSAIDKHLNGFSSPQNVSLVRQNLLKDVSGEDIEQPEQQRHVIESPGTTSNFSTTESSSSGEDDYLLTESEQKHVLLNRLMRYFYSIFSVCPSPGPFYRKYGTPTGDNSSERSGHPEHAQRNEPLISNSAGGSSQDPLRKRGLADEDEDERDGKKLRLTLSSSLDNPNQKLACPFYKNNPQKYHMWRSCIGPGWATVHRIKEHIYRNHTQPISCPRCHEAFETDRLKDIHIGAAERCQVRELLSAEGIDSTQKDLLRSRKRKHKHMTTVEKWNEMYLIIFPDTDPISIPSPYYEYPSITGTATPLSPNNEFVRYEQFLRRELPNRVRQQLEVLIEERLNPLEESMRSELVEIVRDMQIQLFEIYQSSQMAGSDSSRGPILSGNNGIARHDMPSYTDQEATQAFAVAEELQPFFQPPHFNDFAQFDEFDGLIFNFSDVPQCSTLDSGYGSIQSTKDSQCSQNGE